VLNKHEFIVDAEAGQLDKPRMINFVVNNARNLERVYRNMAGALNNFGSAWPVMERRELLGLVVDMHRERLRRLEPLAAAFGINTWEELVKQEPIHEALILSSHVADIVSHAHDISEWTVPCEVRLGVEINLASRVKAALKTHPAYKAWKLNDDALRFFDFDMVDMNELRRMNDEVIRGGVDQGIIMCQLRRRLAQVNNGEVNFWNAATADQAHQPVVSSVF